MLTKDDADASAAAEGARPAIERRERAGGLDLVLTGNWTTRTLNFVDAELAAVEGESGLGGLRIDLSGVGKMDTAGAWVMQRLAAAQTSHGATVEFSGASPSASVLLNAV